MKSIAAMAALVFTEFLRGFSLIFLALFTSVNIFGRKFKKGIVIPLIAGGALAGITAFSLLKTGTVMVTFCLMWAIPPALIAVWYFYTDRKAVSFAVLVFGLIFAESVIYAIENVILAAAANLINGGSMETVQIICYILVFILAILYLELLCRITGGSVTEPLSLHDTALISILTLLVTSSDRSGHDPENLAINADIFDVFVSSVILLCVSLLAVFMIRTNQNKYLERINHLNEEYLNMQSRHFETAKKNDTAVRKINHDMRNHVFCLNELYKGKKYDELGEYLKEMTKAVTDAQPSVKTGSGIADAIIMEKKAAAEQYNVEMTVDGSFETIKISPYDLCTILANLLDNAVEAASHFSVKNRKIDVSCRTAGNFTVLTVKNVTGQAVDVKSDMQTIKGDKAFHGFGLSNVRTAVERVGGDIELTCEPYEGEFLFTAEVFLPNI